MSLNTAESTRVANRVGDVLAGRYRIRSVVGNGGMSAVYRADDEFLGRTVALKVFRRDLADAEDVRRQREEMRVLAGLNHPSLVTLFDAAADDDGRAFLVLEHVDGRDLRDRLRLGPVPAETTALIGADVADALAYIHDRGIVHRDVKPGNVLVADRAHDDTGPRAKLADFGIARLVDGTRLTLTGSVLGTAGYLSPEQAAGEPIGPSSDIYSLGLVLLECLTGERAFEGNGVESAAARLIRDPDVPLSLGSGWRGLLVDMTRRDPIERPDAREVARRLRDLATAAAESAEADDDTRPYSPLELPVITDALALDLPDDAPTDPKHEAQRVPPAAKIAIIAGSILLALVTLLVVVVLANGARAADSPARVVYPAVEGELGAHLEQLQRSVEP